MMNSLYISIFCISEIYFGSVLGYPIRDADSFADRDAASHGSEQTASYGEEKLTLPQISRLIDVYYRLIHSDQEGFIHNLIKDANYRNNHINPTGNEVYDYAKEDSDKNSAKSGRTDESISDSVRSKRQQYWYIHYGKRDHGTSTSDQGMNHPTRKSQPRNYQNVARINNVSSLLLEREHNNKIRAAKSALINSASFRSDDYDGNFANDGFNDEQIHRSDSGEDINREPESAYLEVEPQTAMPKRQQGWYVAYGKRDGYK